jgi:hypothetical protein
MGGKISSLPDRMDRLINIPASFLSPAKYRKDRREGLGDQNSAKYTGK